MGGCLPVHPQPREGESLTSWIDHVTRCNGITIRQLLSHWVSEADWRYRDLDFLKIDELRILADLARVQGGTGKLRSMVLTPWKAVFSEPRNEMDRKGWVCSRATIRYCPICLQIEEPYFRLSWRLLFLPLCGRHGVVLQRGSSRIMPNPSEAPLIKPTNCTLLSRFSSSGIGILESQALSQGFGWSDSGQEFFLVLLTLVRYLNLYLQRRTALDKRFESPRTAYRTAFRLAKE